MFGDARKVTFMLPRGNNYSNIGIKALWRVRAKTRITIL
jgi:hypothetical protein